MSAEDRAAVGTRLLKAVGVDTDKLTTHLVKTAITTSQVIDTTVTQPKHKRIQSSHDIQAIKQGLSENNQVIKCDWIPTQPHTSAFLANTKSLFDQGTLRICVRKANNCIAVSASNISTVCCAVTVDNLFQMTTPFKTDLHPYWGETYEMKINKQAVREMKFELFHKRSVGTNMSIAKCVYNLKNVKDGKIVSQELEMGEVPTGYYKSRTGPTTLEITLSFTSRAIGDQNLPRDTFFQDGTFVHWHSADQLNKQSPHNDQQQQQQQQQQQHVFGSDNEDSDNENTYNNRNSTGSNSTTGNNGTSNAEASRRHRMSLMEDTWTCQRKLTKETERCYVLTLACCMMPVCIKDDQSEMSSFKKHEMDCLTGDLRALRKAFKISRQDHVRLKQIALENNQNIIEELGGRILAAEHSLERREHPQPQKTETAADKNQRGMSSASSVCRDVDDTLDVFATKLWLEREKIAVKDFLSALKNLTSEVVIEIVEIKATNVHERTATASGMCYATLEIGNKKHNLGVFPSEVGFTPSDEAQRTNLPLEAGKPLNTKLTLTIFAQDNIFKDELLGTITVDIDEVIQNGCCDMTFPLGKVPDPNIPHMGQFGYAYVRFLPKQLPAKRDFKNSKHKITHVNKYNHERLFQVLLATLVGIPNDSAFALLQPIESTTSTTAPPPPQPPQPASSTSLLSINNIPTLSSTVSSLSTGSFGGARSIAPSLSVQDLKNDFSHSSGAARGRILRPLTPRDLWIVRQFCLRYGVSRVRAYLTYAELLISHFHSNCSQIGYHRSLSRTITQLVHTVSHTDLADTMTVNEQARYANCLAVLFDFNQTLLLSYKEIFPATVARQFLCPILEVTCALFGDTIDNFYKFLRTDFVKKMVSDRFNGEFERAKLRYHPSNDASSSAEKISFDAWFDNQAHMDVCRRIILELATDVLHYANAFPRELCYSAVVLHEFIVRYNATLHKLLTSQNPQISASRLFPLISHARMLENYVNKALDIARHHTNAGNFPHFHAPLVAVARGTTSITGPCKLTVFVNTASGLASPDKEGGIDAFVEVDCGAVRSKTRVAKTAQNPVWDSPVVIRLPNANIPTITVRVYDYSATLFGENATEVGRCVVDISHTLESQLLQGHVVPFDCLLDDTANGRIRFTLQLTPTKPQEDPSKSSATASTASTEDKINTFSANDPNLLEKIPKIFTAVIDANALAPLWVSAFTTDCGVLEWVDSVLKPIQTAAPSKNPIPQQQQLIQSFCDISVGMFHDACLNIFMLSPTHFENYPLNLPAVASVACRVVFQHTTNNLHASLVSSLPTTSESSSTNTSSSNLSPFVFSPLLIAVKPSENASAATTRVVSKQWNEALWSMNALWCLIAELQSANLLLRHVAEKMAPDTHTQTTATPKSITPSPTPSPTPAPASAQAPTTISVEPEPQPTQQTQQTPPQPQQAPRSPRSPLHAPAALTAFFSSSPSSTSLSPNTANTNSNSSSGHGLAPASPRGVASSLLSLGHNLMGRSASTSSTNIQDVLSGTDHDDVPQQQPATAPTKQPAQPAQPTQQPPQQQPAKTPATKAKEINAAMEHVLENPHQKQRAGFVATMESMTVSCVGVLAENCVGACLQAIAHFVLEKQHRAESTQSSLLSFLSTTDKTESPAEFVWKVFFSELQALCQQLCLPLFRAVSRAALSKVAQTMYSIVVGKSFDIGRPKQPHIDKISELIDLFQDKTQTHMGEIITMDFVLEAFAPLQHVVSHFSLQTDDLLLVLQNATSRHDVRTQMQIFDLLSLRDDDAAATEAVTMDLDGCAKALSKFEFGLGDDQKICPLSSGLDVVTCYDELGAELQVVVTVDSIVIRVNIPHPFPTAIFQIPFVKISKIEQTRENDSFSRITITVTEPALTLVSFDHVIIAPKPSAKELVEFLTNKIDKKNNCEAPRSRLTPSNLHNQGKIACIDLSGRCGYLSIGGGDDCVRFERVLADQTSNPLETLPLSSTTVTHVIDGAYHIFIFRSFSKQLSVRCLTEHSVQTITTALESQLKATSTTPTPKTAMAQQQIQQVTVAQDSGKPAVCVKVYVKPVGDGEKRLVECKCGVVRGLQVVEGVVVVTSRRLQFVGTSSPLHIEIMLQDVEYVQQWTNPHTNLRCVVISAMSLKNTEILELCSVEHFADFHTNFHKAWKDQKGLQSTEVLYVQ